jgi:hypothetical protein
MKVVTLKISHQLSKKAQSTTSVWLQKIFSRVETTKTIQRVTIQAETFANQAKMMLKDVLMTMIATLTLMIHIHTVVLMMMLGIMLCKLKKLKTQI